MTRVETELLERLAKQYGITIPKRAQANQNPLENSMWSNMIDTALKALEIISAATFDWKLLAIAKLLQSWVAEKREEKAKAKQTQEWGAASFNYTTPTPTYTDPYAGRFNY